MAQSKTSKHAMLPQDPASTTGGGGGNKEVRLGAAPPVPVVVPVPPVPKPRPPPEPWDVVYLPVPSAFDVPPVSGFWYLPRPVAGTAVFLRRIAVIRAARSRIPR